MSNESAKCQYIDPISHIECGKWYPYEEGQKFCESHRENRRNHHSWIAPQDHVSKMNEQMTICRQMSAIQLIEHLQNIDVAMRDLARSKQAALIVQNEMKESMTEEERNKVRDYSSKTSYRTPDKEARRKKSPEEKAENRKNGFSKWAARFDLKIEQVMAMDEDELASKIAKYKAAKGA